VLRAGRDGGGALKIEKFKSDFAFFCEKRMAGSTCRAFDAPAAQQRLLYVEGWWFSHHELPRVVR
jgi:hypothetical protein